MALVGLLPGGLPIVGAQVDVLTGVPMGMNRPSRAKRGPMTSELTCSEQAASFSTISKALWSDLLFLAHLGKVGVSSEIPNPVSPAASGGFGSVGFRPRPKPTRPRFVCLACTTLSRGRGRGRGSKWKKSATF